MKGIEGQNPEMYYIDGRMSEMRIPTKAMCIIQITFTNFIMINPNIWINMYACDNHFKIYQTHYSTCSHK